MTADDRLPADDPLDLLGIGLGPFNLSLAALADGVDGLRAGFLERATAFAWHPGLLLEGTTLQVPFLADLVTLVDPTSPWSFLAYLRDRQRLFPFYFSERFQIPRREYDDYLRWAATRLPGCRFGADVRAVAWDDHAGLFTVTWREVDTGVDHTVRARHLVLGIGTGPVVPDAFADLVGEEVVFHSAHYAMARPKLLGAEHVTVVGSGQSGAEVFLDLLQAQPDTGRRLHWLTRSPAFAPMEYSKLGLEHFTPDYTAFFHGLDADVRDGLVTAQWQLHKAISAETIAEIHDLLYERTIGGAPPPATLQPAVEVTAATRDSGRLAVACRHRLQGTETVVTTDAVVLATGYAPRRPAMLDPMAGLVDWDDRGRFRVDRRYRIATDPAVTGRLYVQNGEAHTHGVGAPDLGLGAWRAAVILNDLAGRDVHPLPDRTAFTTFGLA